MAFVATFETGSCSPSFTDFFICSPVFSFPCTGLVSAYRRLPVHFIAVPTWVFLGTRAVIRPGGVAVTCDPVYSLKVFPGYPGTLYELFVRLESRWLVSSLSS
ncbi:hypothetical protein M3J07_013729 [Ascochyta lentis]